MTLQNVADLCGVSRSTASVILNDRAGARYAADTAQRVRDAAAKLGYRPNRLATALLQGGTGTIAALSDRVTVDPFAADLVRSASRRAATAGFTLYSAHHDGDDALLEKLSHRLLDHGVEGFLHVSGSHRRLPVPRAYGDHPVVMVNCLPADEHPRPGLSSVVPDDEEAGLRLGRWLSRPGHARRIVVLGLVVHEASQADPFPGIAGELRVRGLRRALATHPTAEVVQLPCAWSPDDARETLDRWLDADRADVVVALNDRIAMGACAALQRHGFRIGVDVDVQSFDGSDLAGWLDPPVPSLRLPYGDMGESATNLLLSTIAGDHPGGDVVRLPLGTPPAWSVSTG